MVHDEIENERLLKIKEDSIRIAQEQADSIRALHEADSIAAIAASEKGGKAWYKKWYVVATGVGVIGGIVAAILLGGSSEVVDDPTDLPGFPDPPGGAK